MSHAPVLVGLVLAMSMADTCSSATAPAAPSGPTTITVTSVSPDPVEPGGKVTITGSGFQATGNAIKLGGGYLADLASTDGTTITFTLPSGLPVCNPFLSAPCPAMEMLVGPGTYELTVLTRRASSNKVTLVVKEP